MTYYKLGKNREAKEALTQALKLSADFPGAKETQKTLAKLEAVKIN